VSAGPNATRISAAAYFQYSRDKVPDKPVKAGLIGAGDEGGVLIGEHNPEFLEIVAVSDIRPTNQKRIFEGELKKNPTSPRKGLNYHYGRNASKSIKVYERYQDLLARQDIEAVIIALPLVLHAPVAIAALEAGKHVLCEKLMAWNIKQCKDMIAVAQQHDRVLSIGHQHHYSLLYAHALEVLQSALTHGPWSWKAAFLGEDLPGWDQRWGECVGTARHVSGMGPLVCRSGPEAHPCRVGPRRPREQT
jgi:predicted dehydrogenase